MKPVLRSVPAVAALLFGAAFSVASYADDKAVAQAVSNVKSLLQAPYHQDETEKDKSRLPVEMTEFLAVEPGMTVMDMGAGSGYSTEVLSAAVGESGKVYAQNNQHLVDMAGGKIIAQLYSRIENDKLSNVEAVIWEMDEISLENTLDMVFWGYNIHDYYHSVGEQGTLEILASVYKAMKPGAVFAVADHIGVKGQDNAALHRIQPVIIEDLLKKAGFKQAEVSAMYASAADTHLLNVFDDRVKGRTDRYLVKVVK
ncbi:MAG: hypothetical protein CMI03_06820 [Oceanospirillaceae bacterium]|uniref:hypothetical protein n=1 Tax=unclassified Thalassolituus TaxID=2624967 RepID=UPI000C4759A8|nr:MULTISPECIES: hypothetical protein [unclassified Thalassolituus]MAS25330.1 hypothetical protein [Oceanospirillaceae bacterium]MBL34686.1 hypothetical protein [Oceanospirillaceae bacterium]MBS52444.1 hypothetical protein [Oceanospirillaceae bacterium]|tara:strand:- start:328 stop:1095 length:768 start_codon:yes stop_codon:yes gene_type:complete